jgi:hypothetical protein
VEVQLTNIHRFAVLPEHTHTHRTRGDDDVLELKVAHDWSGAVEGRAKTLVSLISNICFLEVFVLLQDTAPRFKPINININHNLDDVARLHNGDPPIADVQSVGGW